jgi:protein-L-isoaspartate(D-aspartate) O-methyltransferase
MNRLTNKLMKNGYLRTDSVIEAFSHVNRIEFVPSDMELQSDIDIPLSIGYGQTISQPTTVAIMMELLDPRPGQKILDIGSGSGWTTALLSCIVGKEGKVIALETVKELCDWGRKNADKMGFVKEGIAEFYNLDGSTGNEARAPYDRILVSATTNEVPQELKDQLKVGGKLVMPVRNCLHYVEKRGENDFYEEEYPGFTFVPLVKKGG